MDNILDNFEEQQNLTDKEIFIQIWTSPRKVFKYINDKSYNKYVTILLMLSGISRAFDNASTKNMGDHMSIWVIVGACIILGGVFGWITYCIYASLISWTGKWLKGQGDTKSILRIISYAMIPSVIGLVFLIPQIGVYGIELFRADGNFISEGWILDIIFFGSAFLEFVLVVCTVIFCIIGIAEVQKFSIGKSILNILLPLLVFLIPLLMIALLTEAF